MSVQKITLKLKAFDRVLIDDSAAVIAKRIQNLNIKVRGPIPLPRRKKVYTVNRSPHVDKKSREHFGIFVYTRIMVLSLSGADGAAPEAVSELMKIDLPAGVMVDIRSEEDR